MSTWTQSARQALDGYLERNRLNLAPSGGDADEIVADLRRHVQEEVAALQLPVVTEHDVNAIVTRIGPVPDGSSTLLERTAPPAISPVAKTSRFADSSLYIFGVCLPVITLVFELMTRFCTGVLFDPIPTWLHVLAIAFVPFAFGLTVAVTRLDASASRSIWIASGLATGISAWYTLALLPFLPFAAVGLLYFGVGMIPLSPLIAFICGIVLRGRLRTTALRHGARPPQGWGWSAVAAFAVLFLMLVPTLLTRFWMMQSTSDTNAISTRAIQRLRSWGQEDLMLRECYGRNQRLWSDLVGLRTPEPEVAQQVYYRVTGRAFNSVTPPLSKYQPAGRAAFDEFEWDTGLGGEAVAGQVRGLSLTQSRLDGLANSDQGWAYLEWTLEFRNEHLTRAREARAQVQLPPGAVVSRLTLWVNDEEREAAFAARHEVREAYQKVAVRERRDPVLVTMSGPDRVLVQCFPVPAKGGRMKVRLGITAPLLMEGSQSLALRLPSLLERNFGLSEALEHSLILESPQSMTRGSNLFTYETGGPEAQRIRGRLTDSHLRSPDAVLRFPFAGTLPEVRALDSRSPEPRLIRQTLAAQPAASPKRIAIVIDGSASMEPFFPEIAAALDQVPAGSEVAIWFVQDGVTQWAGDAARSRSALRETVASLHGRGGQDSVPALVHAGEWAAHSGAVLWIHGPQPMLFDNLEPLKQQFAWRDTQGPGIIDVLVQPGPNRVLEQLGHSNHLKALPRLGPLRQDLERLFATWDGRLPEFRFVRTVEESRTGSDLPKASSHIVRLWAFDQCNWLTKARRLTEAVNLASRYQLVTAVTGAVVLETAAQFEAADLTPVDPASVPSVPEPSTWLLLAFGLVLLFLPATRRQRTRAETWPRT